MKMIQISLSGFILGTWSFLAVAQSVAPVIPDKQHALDTYKSYWEAFEKYETEVLNTERVKDLVAWQEKKDELNAKSEELQQAKRVAIQTTIDKYENVLGNALPLQDRPYVQLNLAQAYLDLSAYSNEKTKFLEKAEVLLRDLARENPSFSSAGQALYVAALVAYERGQLNQSKEMWKDLAARQENSQYRFFALVSLGDQAFAQEDMRSARDYYLKAEQVATQLFESQKESKDRDRSRYELLRVRYRLTWASYRSTELDLTLESARKVLMGLDSAQTRTERSQFLFDTLDLASDALVESQDRALREAYLKDRRIRTFAPGIGSRLIDRYFSQGLETEALAVADFLFEQFPGTYETPLWYLRIMRLHETSKNDEAAASTGRKIADMVLPTQSLWNKRYGSQASERLKDAAIQAAERAADYYFVNGVQSKSSLRFVAGRALYKLLLDAASHNSKIKLEWMLRIAHIEFFLKNHEAAIKAYSDVVAAATMSPEAARQAQYQICLVREQMVRDALTKSVASSEDKRTSHSIALFRAAVDQYAARFASDPKSLELFLVAASLLRDLDQMDAAAGYWERVLLGRSTSQARVTAIRGLMAQRLNSKDASGAIALARRFLQMEDWSRLDADLKVELTELLRSATDDEASSLARSGKVDEAGSLMIDVARHEKNLPKREQLLRDGGYRLALGGKWSEALKVAREFLEEYRFKSPLSGDMKYLEARALEYQLRFALAARSYLELAKTYPQHERAATSADRAKALALAEGDFNLAMEAAKVQVGVAKTGGDRFEVAMTTAKLLEDQKEYEDALQVLSELRKRGSLNNVQESLLRLAESRIGMEIPKQAEASISSLKSLAAQLDANARNASNRDEYKPMAAEAYVLLGMEAKKALESFDLNERRGSATELLGIKARYYDAMARNFDKALSYKNPVDDLRARYEWASASLDYGEEVEAFIGSKKAAMSARQKANALENVNRLRALAKKQYGENLLAVRKNPQALSKNVYAVKTALALEEPQPHELRHETFSRQAVNFEMPMNWSVAP